MSSSSQSLHNGQQNTKHSTQCKSVHHCLSMQPITQPPCYLSTCVIFPHVLSFHMCQIWLLAMSWTEINKCVLSVWLPQLKQWALDCLNDIRLSCFAKGWGKCVNIRRKRWRICKRCHLLCNQDKLKTIVIKTWTSSGQTMLYTATYWYKDVSYGLLVQKPVNLGHF